MELLSKLLKEDHIGLRVEGLNSSKGGYIGDYIGACYFA